MSENYSVSEKEPHIDIEKDVAQEAFKVFEQIAQRLIQKARNRIEQEYTIEKGFTYHNIGHTEFAVELVQKLNEIGEKYGLQDKIDSIGALLATWYHDLDLVEDTTAPEGIYRRVPGGASEFSSESSLLADLGEEYQKIIDSAENSERNDFIKALHNIRDRVLSISNEAIPGTIPEGTLRMVTEEEVCGLIEDTSLCSRFMEHVMRSFPVDKPMVLSISQDIAKEGKNPSIPAFNVTSSDLFQVAAMSSDRFEIAGDGELHESKRYIKKDWERITELSNVELARMRFDVIAHIDFQPGFTEEQYMYALKNAKNNIERHGAKLIENGHNISEVMENYKNVFPNFVDRIVSSLDRCDRWRQKYPLLFVDPLKPDNNPDQMVAFNAVNREESIRQLREMVRETLVPRLGAA